MISPARTKKNQIALERQRLLELESKRTHQKALDAAIAFAAESSKWATLFIQKRGKRTMSAQAISAYRLARKTDPVSSHIGARNKLSGRRQQVLDLVKAHPGATSGELSRHMLRRYPDLPIRTCAETPHKRLPELESLGLVRRGGMRKCKDSGNQALTWWLK